jgi:carboxyl-terminal processing protease
MKLRFPLFLSLAAGVTMFYGFRALRPSGNEPNPKREALIVQSLVDGLEHLHYSPLNINDDFSEKAFDLYLDRLDRGKRFLSKNDIAQLKQYRDQVDDQLNKGDLSFFDLSVFLFKAGVERAKAIYPEILSKPFDFSTDETVEMDAKKRDYASSADEQSAVWRKVLKEEVLSNISNKLEEQKKAQEKKEGDAAKKAETPKTFDELETQARKDVKETYDKWFTRLEKLQRKDHLETYLNAITNVFDPHTGYFSPSDKESFDINMSGKFEGIGARLQSDGEQTKISEIIPGGPSWKLGDALGANDIILKVGQGETEAEDIKGWQIDDVVQKIRGKKGTVVKLTIKKPDGTIKIVPITRDVVIIEEGYAKSAVLEQENSKTGKIGYIYLPRFYADFSDEGDGRNCYVDVKQEIAKLKNEGINGLILDLRGNGGGSLRDVVKMSGLFIEKGPIVQVKTRGYKPSVLDDTDPDVQYDGQMVVLVDFYSASASEILAAAMQDYKRAVIVGSSSTYGKGTVQRFIDLDAMVRGNSDVKPLGSVKMTIQKFYRVDGGATQLKGVVPDIVLPDRYDYIPMGEKENDYPMDWSQIDAVPYGQNVVKMDNLNVVKAASAKRVKENPDFQLIAESAKLLKQRKDESNVSLNFEEYEKKENKLEEENKKFDNLMKENIPGLQATNLAADVEWVQQDTARVARNQEWLNDLKKDIYLEEAIHILSDLKDGGRKVAKKENR